MGLTALSLGSNSGDRGENIRQAVKFLEEAFGKVNKSTVYETTPFYESQKGQENFYNCCVNFRTENTPEEILEKIQAIENKMGRERPYPNAPRIIDIDIIFIGDEMIAQENLTVPHPAMQERLFVLVPLVEIMGSFEHPAIGLSVDDLFYECPDDGILVEIENFWET